mgnify:CR=1 FL=1
MAISVNKIYQTVLALANKEQRGYITPQEFNLFADQAQMDIFEQYFYDLNQFKRAAGNDTMYGDMVNILEEKIVLFEKSSGNLSPSSLTDRHGFFEGQYNIPNDMYRLIEVLKVHPAKGVSFEVEKLSIRDYERAVKSPLTRGTSEMCVCAFRDDMVNVSPLYTVDQYADQIRIEYIKKPNPANWGYMVVNEKPLYNSDASSNFELHDSEQKNLVIKILQLAGISIKDYNVTQAAAQEEVKTIQQQKS